MVVINADQWEKGTGGDSDKEAAILKAFAELNDGEAMDMKEIKAKTGEKWVFGAVKKLLDAGKLERKKFGKKFGYRLVQ